MGKALSSHSRPCVSRMRKNQVWSVGIIFKSCISESLCSLYFFREHTSMSLTSKSKTKRKLIEYEFTLRSTQVEDVAMKEQNRRSKILSPIKRRWT